MREDVLRPYFELSPQAIWQQLTDITARQLPEPGQRQVPFHAIETLLCYGLFYLLGPHRYGGANIHTVPPVVQTLAEFFRRMPSSLTNKMLNLDGSRTHSARQEPLLFASLASDPARYHALYSAIIASARDLSLSEQVLPDFLQRDQSFSDMDL